MANKLIIDIDGNAKGLENKLNSLGSTAKKAFSGVETVGTNAVKGIAAGVGAATTAVSGLVAAAVKGYAEYEQLTGGIETLFKSSSGIVKDYAENAYKTAGLSANQYMDTMMSFSASLLQGLGGDTNEAARIGNIAIEDMSDNVNKMGSSMGEVQDAYRGFAKQNYTMLDNLNLGYGGSREEMLRLVNDAGIAEQKFTDLNQVSFDQIIMAIHKVQENTEVTGTTAEEAEKTISGSANMARAAWANLVVGIADDNQDFKGLVDKFVESTATLMGNLMPRVKMALEGVGKLINTLLPVIIAQIPYIVDTLLPMILNSGLNIINALLTGIQQNMPLLLTSATTIMTTLYNGVLAISAQLMPIAQELIGKIAEGFLMYQSLIWTIGINLLAALITGIEKALPTLIPMAQTMITNIVDLLSEQAPKMLQAAINIILALANGLIEVLPTILPQIGTLMSELVQILIDNAPLIIDASAELIAQLLNGMANDADLGGKIILLVVAIANAVVENAPKLWDAGLNLIIGLLDGIWDNRQLILDKIGELLKNLIDSVLEIFGIESSPSTVFEGIGDDMIQGLLNGITETWASITEWAGGLLDTVTGWFSGIDLAEIGSNIIGSLKTGLENAWGSVSGWFTDKFAGIKGMFGGGKTGAVDAEGNPIEALDPGTMTAEVTNMMTIDPMSPVPQNVIDSYTALSTALIAVNAEVAKLNGFFGGAVAAEGAAAEGGGGSLLAGMTALADYISGTMTTALTDFGDFLVGTFIPNVDLVRKSLYIAGGGGSTLYNALGAIQGIVEDIIVLFLKLVNILKIDFEAAVEKAKEEIGELVGELEPLERKGWAIRDAFVAALAAIEAVMKAQNGASTKNNPIINDNRLRATAWGGWTSSKGLTLVGERGPELIGTSRMMNVWRNDEIQKRLSVARDKVNTLSSSMMNVIGSRSIDQSTTNNNSTSMNFGNVYGESYLNEMIESVVDRYSRKAVWLGSKG